MLVLAAPPAWGQSATSSVASSTVATSSIAFVVESTPASDSEAIDSLEVVITGSRTEKKRAETTVVTEVIRRQEIVDSGAENLTEMLEEHPGVQLERAPGGTTTLKLQGLNPEQVLVLVDGERVTGRIRGGTDLNRFNLENVERIEIVKGASSALYGSDAMGGVINIIPRKSREPLSADARLTYGSFGTLDGIGSFGFRSGPISSFFSGGYHRSDGFDLNTNDPATNGAAYSEYNIANLSVWEADADTKFRVRGDYRLQDLEAVDFVAPRAVIDRNERIETYSISAGPEIQFENGSRLKTSIYHSFFRQQYVRDQRGGSEYDDVQDNRQRTSQLTVQYDRLWFDDHFVTMGFDGIVEVQEVDFIQNGRGTRKRAAGYVQDDWPILKDEVRLTVVPGLRFDHDSQFGSRPSPKIAVRFDPLKTLALRFSYGWGFRAPSFEELYLSFVNAGSGYRIDGNPELTAETSHGVNASIEWSPLSIVSGYLGFYHNEVTNLINTLRTPAVSAEGLSLLTYGNVADARTTGIEAYVTLRFLEQFTFDVGYDLTDTEDRALDRPLQGRSKHRFSGKLSWFKADWGTRAMARAQWSSAAPLFADYTFDGVDDATPAFTTLDLKVQQTLFNHLTLFVGAENLLDAQDAVLLPLYPRSFFAGIQGQLLPLKN